MEVVSPTLYVTVEVVEHNVDHPPVPPVTPESLEHTLYYTTSVKGITTTFGWQQCHQGCKDYSVIVTKSKHIVVSIHIP